MPTGSDRDRSENRGTQTVGASLLAMVVNDDAGNQYAGSVLGFFAGKPAPTVV